VDKDLNYYMELPYTIEMTPEESGGYFIRIKELTGCMSYGETEGEALENIKEAKESWLEVAIKEGCEIPLPIGV